MYISDLQLKECEAAVEAINFYIAGQDWSMDEEIIDQLSPFFVFRSKIILLIASEKEKALKSYQLLRSFY